MGKYGLKCFHNGFTLPLEQVDVSAKILQDLCCEVTVKQHFRMPRWGLMRRYYKNIEQPSSTEEIEGDGETTENKVKALYNEMELPGEYIHRTFLEQEGVDVGEILHDIELG